MWRNNFWEWFPSFYSHNHNSNHHQDNQQNYNGQHNTHGHYTDIGLLLLIRKIVQARSLRCFTCLVVFSNGYSSFTRKKCMRLWLIAKNKPYNCMVCKLLSADVKWSNKQILLNKGCINIKERNEIDYNNHNFTKVKWKNEYFSTQK